MDPGSAAVPLSKESSVVQVCPGRRETVNVGRGEPSGASCWTATCPGAPELIAELGLEG